MRGRPERRDPLAADTLHVGERRAKAKPARTVRLLEREIAVAEKGAALVKGTPAAAAVTAGAVARIMQWALVQQNDPVMSNAAIKNMLIRGAKRSDDRGYPNREWGYGALDVYQAFEYLRL